MSRLDKAWVIKTSHLLQIHVELNDFRLYFSHQNYHWQGMHSSIIQPVHLLLKPLFMNFFQISQIPFAEMGLIFEAIHIDRNQLKMKWLDNNQKLQKFTVRPQQVQHKVLWWLQIYLDQMPSWLVFAQTFDITWIYWKTSWFNFGNSFVTYRCSIRPHSAELLATYWVQAENDVIWTLLWHLLCSALVCHYL